jgi:hypothetical protein
MSKELGRKPGRYDRLVELLRKPHWWLDLLIAAWVLVAVTVYFRLQILRLIEVAQAQAK